MFTGIIQDIGKVVYFSPHQKRENLKISSKLICRDASVGDSVSVNGVCLTVTKIKNDILTFDLLAETIKLTNLGLLKVGSEVNLETSLKIGDKICGHFVTGHIDCLGIIQKKGIIKNNYFLQLTVPKNLMVFLVPKGSVAVDGISLTVVEVFADSFTVYLIAHTLNNTILRRRQVSDKVNIEFDILAKYCQNLLLSKRL